jgi:hypothetical protein
VVKKWMKKWTPTIHQEDIHQEVRKTWTPIIHDYGWPKIEVSAGKGD